MEPYLCSRGGMYSNVMDYSVIGFSGTRVFKNNDLFDISKRPGGGSNSNPKENVKSDLNIDSLFSDSVEGDIMRDLGHHYNKNFIPPWWMPD